MENLKILSFAFGVIFSKHLFLPIYATYSNETLCPCIQMKLFAFAISFYLFHVFMTKKILSLKCLHQGSISSKSLVEPMITMVRKSRAHRRVLFILPAYHFFFFNFLLFISINHFHHCIIASCPWLMMFTWVSDMLISYFSYILLVEDGISSCILFWCLFRLFWTTLHLGQT